MNIELPLVREELVNLFKVLRYERGAEVGTDQGIFAEVICKANPGVKLYCIDPWKSYGEYKDITKQDVLDDNFRITEERLKPYNCEIVRKTSLDAVKDFQPESLDFVYIDGNHEYSYVMEDLKAWSKIVKRGGIISGHDYRRKGHKHGYEGVTRAVNEYLETKGIKTLFLTVRNNQSSYFFINEYI